MDTLIEQAARDAQHGASAGPAAASLNTLAVGDGAIDAPAGGDAPAGRTHEGAIDLDAPLPRASLPSEWRALCRVLGCQAVTLGHVLAGAGSSAALARLKAAGAARGVTLAHEMELAGAGRGLDARHDAHGPTERCATLLAGTEAADASGGWSDVSAVLSDAFLANATCLRPLAPGGPGAAADAGRARFDRPFIASGSATSGDDVAEWRRRWSREAFLASHGHERFATSAFPYAGVYSAKTAAAQPSHSAHARPLIEIVDATRRAARTLEVADASVLARRPATVTPYVFSAEHRSRSSRRFLLEVAHSLAAVTDGHCARDEKFTPKLIQFFLGPAYSGAPPHVHGAAWNGLAHGLKLWFFFPPSQGYYVSKPIVEWLEEDLPQLPFQPLLAVQRAGDVVYVPSEWSHAVLNLRESIGVAEEYSCQPAG